MVQKELQIAGMNCSHCVMTVKQQLARMPQLKVLDVKIGFVSVAYEESKVTPAQIETVLAEAGYSIVH
jgi:copper chaperone CopZ